jgi:streptogramin lyase
MRPTRLTLALAAAVAAFAVVPPVAGAAPVLNGDFQLTGTPGQMTLGPDGNVWVLISGSSANNEVAKVAPSGAVTEFDVNELIGAVDVVSGPDGNLWATKTNNVVKFSPSNPAGAVSTPVTGITDARGITSAAGDLWAASADKLVKIPPANPAGATSTTITGMGARGISRGSDGSLWIADFTGARIVNVSPANPASQTFYATGGSPQETEGGASTQAGYTDPGSNPQHIGRITPGGQPTKLNVPMTDPFGITLGADGAYYIAQFAGNTVTRLTSGGQSSTISGLNKPRYLVAGAGNTVWVGEEGNNKVARISGVTKPAGGGGDVTAPVLCKLKAKGRAGSRPTVRFSLSEVGSVQVRVDRRTAGKRRGTTCVKPSAKLRGAKRCTRYVRAATLKAKGVAGKNKLRLANALVAGSYRVTVTAKDVAGNAAKARRLTLRVKAAK